MLAQRLLLINIHSLKPEGYLSDYAHVVDPAAKQKIEQYCLAVDKTLGVQIALVTIDFSLDGRPIEDFSIRLARHFQPGQKEKNTGVLVLLVIKDHQSRIEVGYGVEPDLTDGMSAVFYGLCVRNYGPASTGGALGCGAGYRGPHRAIKRSSSAPGRVAAPRTGGRPFGRHPHSADYSRYLCIFGSSAEADEEATEGVGVF